MTAMTDCLNAVDQAPNRRDGGKGWVSADYDHIAAWGEAHLDFLRRHLPYTHGVPGGRWLTILMNRISPALFSAAFTAWVRETWPNRPDCVAIDGKTSRRSHDRAAGTAPIHLPTQSRRLDPRLPR